MPKEIDVKLDKDFQWFEQPIVNREGVLVGWHSQIHDLSNTPVSGGTHKDQKVARQIALAEFYERKYFSIYSEKSESVQKALKLDEYPSTAGFACGFERNKTKWRAVCEGLERWAWSKWIDEKFKVTPLNMKEVRLSSLGKASAELFEDLHFFEKTFSLSRFDFGYDPEESASYSQKELIFTFRVFLGETARGVFTGSRVVLNREQPWEHEIIEAKRNLDNFDIWSPRNPVLPTGMGWFVDRVLFFGRNKAEALNQIKNSENESWPQPSLDLIKELEVDISGVYLWRCLFKNFCHWGSGDLKRFVI